MKLFFFCTFYCMLSMPACLTLRWRIRHSSLPGTPARYRPRCRGSWGWGRRRSRCWCCWACGKGCWCPYWGKAWRNRRLFLAGRWWWEGPRPGQLSKGQGREENTQERCTQLQSQTFQIYLTTFQIYLTTMPENIYFVPPNVLLVCRVNCYYVGWKNVFPSNI